MSGDDREVGGPGSGDGSNDEGQAGDAGDGRTVSIGEEGFRPGGRDGGARRDAGAGTTAGLEDAAPSPAGGFDWRGWLLVVVLVVCFLVIPAFVVLRPFRVNDFQTTYLLLPLVPAFLLGATAVWVAVRSRQG